MLENLLLLTVNLYNIELINNLGKLIESEISDELCTKVNILFSKTMNYNYQSNIFRI
jgi:hypothetical protein